MGLFDKIKNISNLITGNGAEVSLQVSGGSVNEIIIVDVTAVIKENPIRIEKVYLYVKSVEQINIPDSMLPKQGDRRAEPVDIYHDVFDRQEYVLAPAQILEASKTYNWSYDLYLPGYAVPSYEGKYANHDWKFYAGLDAKGNDPDSGWINVTLR